MDQFKNKIAVIGMACRFPGANNLDEYWENLILGRDTIKHFTSEELLEFEFDRHRNNPDYVNARGMLDDIDKFDAGFFGMTPGEAAVTDPQHRVWLETAWKAFEDASCNPIDYPGTIAVFAGGNMSSYLSNSFLRDWDGSAESTQMWLGNDTSFIPTKTAFHFNLRGPAINVQTACSTSLVAVAQACQSLYSFESDICLAGGITISVPQGKGYIFQEGGIHSPDGFCRTFDAQAKGTVFSNGVGAVVLKRMEDAIRDHDSIYALVSGWAINNDGSNKMSYTAPSVEGQAEVIMMAQSFAEISPEEISYIEAHGTATQIGDPIEIAALTKAFNATTNKKQFCGIGSVKSNIGHTDSAAGIASFIKVCLAAYYKNIPPSLHYTKPNPHIDFKNSPFYVLNQLKEWTEEKPLIMGVSSFGIGGTNAHVIVEQPPVPDKTGESESEWPDLLVLSAKSEDSLERRKQDLIEFLKGKPDLNIHDVTNTLVFGRKHMQRRSFIVAANLEEIISGDKTFTDGVPDHQVSKIAFMFPGQGSQYLKMGFDLYQKNKTFTDVLDECFEIVNSETGEDIKAILFESNNAEESDRRLASTEITQTALFIIEYALSKVLEKIDIRPDYLIGHSIGEYTAACLAGVFDLQTALKIVIKRGHLMRKMPSGNMLAVRTGIEKLKVISDSCFEIAADNAAESCTISFKSQDNDKVKALLDKNEIQYIPLNTSHAFHSAAFDPIISEFSEYVSQFRLKAPELPFISCLTGTFITAEQATSGAYWAQQLRNTVLFCQGISKIAENEGTVFIEVGPNTHLNSLVRQSKNVANKILIVSTLGKADNIEERYKVLAALGNMYNAGYSINFEVLRQGREPRKIGLPTYPFERKRHWIEFKQSDIGATDDSSVKKSDQSTFSVGDNLSPQIIIKVRSGLDTTTDKIAGIWKLIIGRDEIGFDEDFFKIGGHSLLALQILTRIKEDLGSKISLKDFYVNPTINQLGAFIDSQTVGSEESIEMVHLTETTNLPLTRNQKRLWLISQLQPDIPSYIIPLTYKFNGLLNRELFERSLSILFHRHYLVFSVIKEANGNPYCEILQSEVKVTFIDYAGIPEDEKGKRVEDTFISASRKAFDLKNGPLYRLYLIRTAADEYYFHMSIHHIIFDGYSIGVFVNDLNEIYNSLIRGKEIDLEELEFQQFDYAQWDNGKEDKEESIAFWDAYLKDCSPILNFPYDFPRKEQSTGRASSETLRLTKAMSEKLRQITREEDSSLFTTMMSVFGLLLHNYSGEDDLNIGLPVAYRPHTKLEKIVGMFVNTVVVRLRCEKGVTFRELIKHTQDSAMNAISHQDLAFERVVEIAKPDRSFNANPLFQVCFVWQNNLNLPIKFDGIESKRISEKERTSIFDITFYLWENGSQIEGEIEYNVDIIKQDTIMNLRDNFFHLLQLVVENPDQKISELSIVSEDNKKKLDEFNRTEVPIPDFLVQSFFEKQSEVQLSKTAVISGNSALTYKELNDTSNQLANHLISLGVTKGDIVGICVERSVEMVISILGILKAGCCYLPLDPSFPDERINYMIMDSGAKVLISQNTLKEKFQHLLKISLILIDKEWNKIKEKSRVKPASDLTPQSPAYIIYTSGSTGKPKGVMVHHQAIVNLIISMSKTPGIKENDILLAVVTLSFDMSVFELFLPLSNGATIVIAETKDTTNGQALINLIDKFKITMIQATPSFWNILLSGGWKGKNKLKALCGGEALTSGLVRQILPKVGEFWNCYGPTETTVYSTCIKVVDPNAPILIGKPLNNTSIHILDKNNNQLPIGVIGEVCIGGSGVTKGYNNRPDLTKEKFIKIENDQIIYKTGDQGRFLNDGNIELFGRIDNQIKLRGFRIEPGEIESLLSQVPDVKDAVVKIHNFDDDDNRLVAFLNVSDDFNIDAKELNRRLKEKLPSYMIPSAYRMMKEFPKTNNGKIDRKSLIYEINEFGKSGSDEIKTLTSTEKIIFKIWSETLKTDEITITDNFFDLGGNSLLAIAVFSRIESAFNLEIGLRVFFDSPRIKDLGEAIDISIQKSIKKKTAVKNEKSDLKIVRGEI